MHLACRSSYRNMHPPIYELLMGASNSIKLGRSSMQLFLKINCRQRQWSNSGKLFHTSCSACDKHRVGKFADKDKPGSRWVRFERPPQPWTAFMPTEKGHDMTPPDDDIPMTERVVIAANWWKEQAMKIKEEVQYIVCDREPLGGLGYCYKDAETKIEFKFDNPETFDKFTVSGDQDWDQGFSEAELVPSKHATGIFRGNLDTSVPKDGTVTRAGWVNLKSDKQYHAFHRAKVFEHWMNFTHFIIKVRGDGRIYMINLNSPGQFDVSWGDIWSFPLFTHGGPYWQITKIPFSKFYLGVYGRIQDHQVPYLQGNRCNSVGITLMDRIDGPFQLEVDWMGVYYDVSHREDFAYELYKVPWGIH